MKTISDTPAPRACAWCLTPLSTEAHDCPHCVGEGDDPRRRIVYEVLTQLEEELPRLVRRLQEAP